MIVVSAIKFVPGADSPRHISSSLDACNAIWPKRRSRPQRAAQLEPAEISLLDFGNSLIKLNAFDAAATIFAHGLGKFPQSAPLRAGMGITHYSRGQYAEAVEVLCEAADLDPEDPRPYLFLGEMYGVFPEKAEEVTQRMAQFVKYHPRDARAHYYYAVNLRHGRRDDRAKADLTEIEKLLKSAIALNPDHTLAHFELGVLYADQQKYEPATKSLRAAIQLDPRMEKAHYRLAQIYLRTGQNELAEREMQIFARLKGETAPSDARKQPLQQR